MIRLYWYGTPNLPFSLYILTFMLVLRERHTMTWRVPKGGGFILRFGFNGKENDDEVKGTGNQQDYGFRIYDPRLGRFLSVDPLTKQYPWYTPYQFAGNNPIWAKDLDGLEEDIVIGKQAQTKPVLKLSKEDQVRFELVRSTVDLYVEQVYAGQNNVDAEKQFAKAVITTRSFAVKDNNGNYTVVINITSPQADGKDHPVLDFFIKKGKEELQEYSVEKFGEKVLKLAPFTAKVASQVVGYVLQDGEIGENDTPFKPINPVQEVLSKAQHYEAKKNLQSDVTNAVNDANTNFAPSESTQPNK